MAFAHCIAIAIAALQGCVAKTLPGHNSNASAQWEVLIVNLARRKDRLDRFAKTVQEKEPWLLGDAKVGGGLCRILGRDSSNLRLSHSGNLRQGISLKQREAHSSVPLDLLDSSTLVRDGWVTAQAVDDAQSPAAVWPIMTRGGIGLYLGHAAAWQHIVNHDLTYGLVVEDDLTLFAPSFKDQVSALLQGHTHQGLDDTISWDFLYLQRCDDETWLKERVDQPKPVRSHNGSSKLVTILSDDIVTCTGAYIVTQRGAKLLLDVGLPAKKQLDAQLSDVPGLRRAALTPPVAQCGEVLDGGCRDTDVQKVDQPAAAVSKLTLTNKRLAAKLANTQNLMKAIGGLANAIHQPCSQTALDSHDGDGTNIALTISDCSDTA